MTLGGRYEIRSVLGVGGMAAVYKAFDQRLKRDVAVKVLLDEATMDRDARRRFRREYQLISRLSHPHIRSVYDVVTDGSTEYIVMEYVEGANLKQYLKQKGILSWREVQRFSTQIAKALNHAHSKGVIHMDIKPQNIILTKDGTAKVADFGIAQLEESADGASSGEALGSIHYISPEQARGEAVDARTDIYSLGVMMYEMLTGRLPFEGKTVEEVASQHFTVLPDAPSVLNPDIPAALEEITLKAMQPHLEDRYRSMSDMLAELENFRKGVTAAARQAPVQKPPVRKNNGYEKQPRLPRAAAVGEISKEGYALRLSKQQRISDLLGFGITLLFVLVLFALVWNDWLGDIFVSNTVRLEVPDFVGAVITEVTDAGDLDGLFHFTVEYKADAAADEGVVIAQTTAAGSSRTVVSDGIEVKLTVSAGAQMVEIPDLVNCTFKEAQVQLQSLGLEVETVMEASNSVTENYVIAMDPAPGASTEAGSTVILTVSAGPDIVYATVPNVIGMSKTEALLALQQAGLVCSEANITYVSSTAKEMGNVVWQNYAGGNLAVSGSVVYLQVGSGPSVTAATEPTAAAETGGTEAQAKTSAVKGAEQ